MKINPIGGTSFEKKEMLCCAAMKISICTKDYRNNVLNCIKLMSEFCEKNSSDFFYIRSRILTTEIHARSSETIQPA